MRKQKINKLILTFAILMPFAIVFTQAQVSKLNSDVNDLHNTIVQQKKINDSLEMLSYELGSKDHLSQIAQANGMGLTNKSVKVND